MTSKFITAVDSGLLKVNPQQKWVKANLHYEVIMGSQAYGVANDSSDMDIYGWCIPPKSYIFPHTDGYIYGFGPKPQGFEQFIQHHVEDAQKKTEYDFTIYSIVKYLDLVAQNNPNMIDSIFVPFHCITHMTELGSMLRDKRKEFLHKGSYHKFKGYAYAQIQKVKTKVVHEDMSPKRRESIEKFGYDTKFSYHCIRLLDECEQILGLGDIDLQRNNEQLKAIRRGDWTLEQLIESFELREKNLQSLYDMSKLPEYPNWTLLQNLLFNMLEHHYGSLSDVKRLNQGDEILSDLKKLVEKYS